MEAALVGHGDVLIPFTKAAVTEVSLSSRSITIDPIAAGLVDDNDVDDGPRPDFGAAKGGFGPERRPRGPKGAGGNR